MNAIESIQDQIKTLRARIIMLEQDAATLQNNCKHQFNSNPCVCENCGKLSPSWCNNCQSTREWPHKCYPFCTASGCRERLRHEDVLEKETACKWCRDHLFKD